MRTSTQDLDRIVLEAVSDDYQSFESVVSKLSRMERADCEAPDVERILLTSLANHLVAAYLLHADPPYATEVGIEQDNIRTYWFFITQEGRHYLDRLLLKQAIAPRTRRHS
jgi:hypothetical protein